MKTDSMDGMDSALYDDGESQDAPEQKDKMEEATDLMSKSSFPGGCKVGDKYTVEITGDHGDQFSVKVMGDEEETKDHAEPDEDDMAYNKEY